MKHAKKQTTKNAGKARKAPKLALVASAPKATSALSAKPRDARLPAPGTTIVRPYKGKDYRVTVLDGGFRYDGREFRSLSKLASEISGQPSVNGFLWFRLIGTAAAAAPAPEMPNA